MPNKRVIIYDKGVPTLGVDFGQAGVNNNMHEMGLTYILLMVLITASNDN